MRGRVRRKLALEATAPNASVNPVTCLLCSRALGRRVEWHHLIPKSQGGTETAPVHPICHRTIHATLTNADLARNYADADADALRSHPALARFIAWIADKPPDFHAPTRRGKRD